MSELLPDLVSTAGVAVRPRLPTPARTRWQPLRLGLVNLYRFDDETFAFEDGRLLLRGNNGTGKSRVLALTLPFLFDGRIEPHRVEPDGDPAKRMVCSSAATTIGSVTHGSIASVLVIHESDGRNVLEPGALRRGPRVTHQATTPPATKDSGVARQRAILELSRARA